MSPTFDPLAVVRRRAEQHRRLGLPPGPRRRPELRRPRDPGHRRGRLVGHRRAVRAGGRRPADLAARLPGRLRRRPADQGAFTFPGSDGAPNVLATEQAVWGAMPRAFPLGDGHLRRRAGALPGAADHRSDDAEMRTSGHHPHHHRHRRAGGRGRAAPRRTSRAERRPALGLPGRCIGRHRPDVGPTSDRVAAVGSCPVIADPAVSDAPPTPSCAAGVLGAARRRRRRRGGVDPVPACSGLDGDRRERPSLRHVRRHRSRATSTVSLTALDGQPGRAVRPARPRRDPRPVGRRWPGHRCDRCRGSAPTSGPRSAFDAATHEQDVRACARATGRTRAPCC